VEEIGGHEDTGTSPAFAPLTGHKHWLAPAAAPVTPATNETLPSA